MDAHRIGEERSLELHREIARRLMRDPRVLLRARAQVARQIDEGRGVAWARAWQSLLEGPLEALLAMMTDPGEQGRAMRQATPFAGVIEPRERWRIWRQVRARCEEGR